MVDLTASVAPAADAAVVPPPRRRPAVPTLGIHAVQLITRLGLLALAPSGVGVLLDRLAHRPLFFLLSPANANDLPFADPLLWVGRALLARPIHVVRADGAYWGGQLVRFIVTVIGARPLIPFNRQKQPLARVRHADGPPPHRQPRQRVRPDRYPGRASSRPEVRLH